MEMRFEQSGFEKFKVYSLAEVSPFICTGYHRTFNLPTEVVVREVKIVVPEQGRIWNTEFDYDGGCDEKIPRVYCAEWYEDSGDDGHTSMRLEGFVFYDGSDWKRFEESEPKKNWKGEIMPFDIMDYIREEVWKKRDEEEKRRREERTARGLSPWDREDELRDIDPQDQTIAGLQKRLSTERRNAVEQLDKVRAEMWRLKERFKRLHRYVSEDLVESISEESKKRWERSMVEYYNPEKLED